MQSANHNNNLEKRSEGYETPHHKRRPGLAEHLGTTPANQRSTEPAPDAKNDLISSAACTSTCWRVALQLAQPRSLCNQMISCTQLFSFLLSSGLFVVSPALFPLAEFHRKQS
ncbi:hypothetical protein CMEL01_10314 [Colletotrichum melonis]|uniref:Uncharacterized protein n=1 Tax=Colletotrichum melonis TaxID=1209925 RepID=A0AAI9TWG2_9PEZI|nr:hypothetical protein CMEL01_10314 [Colletotrichum melonis]